MQQHSSTCSPLKRADPISEHLDSPLMIGRIWNGELRFKLEPCNAAGALLGVRKLRLAWPVCVYELHRGMKEDEDRGARARRPKPISSISNQDKVKKSYGREAEGKVWMQFMAVFEAICRGSNRTS